jgi:hypothetical protein
MQKTHLLTLHMDGNNVSDAIHQREDTVQCSFSHLVLLPLPLCYEEQQQTRKRIEDKEPIA